MTQGQEQELAPDELLTQTLRRVIGSRTTPPTDKMKAALALVVWESGAYPFGSKVSTIEQLLNGGA